MHVYCTSGNATRNWTNGCRAQMRRGNRRAKMVSRSSKTASFFSLKRGRPPSAKASRNSTNITNPTKRKSDEEFDVQKRSPKILKNRPKPSANVTRKSTCQTSPHVTLFMSVLRLSLGKSRPVVGRCHSSLSGDHRPKCSASCSCRPAHRQCKARAAELSAQLQTVAVSLHGHQVGALLSGLAGMCLRGQYGTCRPQVLFRGLVHHRCLL